jgi:polysaccharide biosynthesis transport protein
LTSPEPGDGKTTSASNLAIAIAQTGRSVLLLDADFRKPTQHKNLDVADALGLSGLLAGKASLEQAIQHTGVAGLDILPCGPIPANPSEILNSRQFGELLDELSGRYDHVVLDSPPCNLVADARILGAVCDVTILVLRADKSTRSAGAAARDALGSVGARVLGTIVNDAPRKTQGYYGHYYGQQGPMPMLPPARFQESCETTEEDWAGDSPESSAHAAQMPQEIDPPLEETKPNPSENRQRDIA